MKYREMLVTVRDRIQKLKTAGRSEKEVVAGPFRSTAPIPFALHVFGIGEARRN